MIRVVENLHSSVVGHDPAARDDTAVLVNERKQLAVRDGDNCALEPDGDPKDAVEEPPREPLVPNRHGDLDVLAYKVRKSRARNLEPLDQAGHAFKDRVGLPWIKRHPNDRCSVQPWLTELNDNVKTNI